MNILGVDPGRQKTGLALIDQSGQILWRSIVPTDEFGVAVARLLEEWPVDHIALGHSTGSEAAAIVLKKLLEARPSPVKVGIVDERDSTLEARELYFEAHPPLGLRRLIPRGLQCPSEPIDDFAAAILARRALKGRSQST
jgi:RNase H-fold protein (predicted Holliday junction resolvase)